MAVVSCAKCGAKNRVDEGAAAAGRQAVCGNCGATLADAVGGAAGGDSSHPVVVTDASFEREVLGAAAGQPVLVDFWAEWCGPCRMLAPALDQLAAESGGRYTIAKLNVDENPATASRYHIRGIPAMLIFKDGRLVDQLVGLHPKQAIAAKLAAHA